LDVSLAQNEALVKENKLHKKDLEAMENRLLEKEKLISMLVMQKGDKERELLSSKHKWELDKDEKDKEKETVKERDKDKVKKTKMSYNNSLSNMP
jgi:antitoxin component YwqK of YwqJK toxin-antitoxin module